MLGLAYGGLGAMQASQYAFNTIYAVPRNHQPNPIRSRTRSAGLLLILGTAIIVSTGINVAISNADSVASQLGTGLTIVGYLADLAINIGHFSLAFRVLTARDLHWRDVMVGGVVAGALWRLLQALGSRYVVHEVQHGSVLYGVFGVVLATVAWIYLVALVVMLSAEVNVVRQRRLWPRSLLPPFTDQIVPTQADLVSYTSYAHAPRFKGWQRIEVDFDPPGRPGIDARPGGRPGRGSGPCGDAGQGGRAGRGSGPCGDAGPGGRAEGGPGTRTAVPRLRSGRLTRHTPRLTSAVGGSKC